MAPASAPSMLLSWVDLRTDPYARGKDGVRDKTQAGPTLTLLFDPESPYRDAIKEVVLFYRKPLRDPQRHEDFAVADATRKEIERLSSRSTIRVELVPWHGEDPTDHPSIFNFLREQVTRLGGRHPERPIVIHISPGTPAMQTVWVLMAEMGLIRAPFTAVKSLRRAHRAGRPAAVPVELDIPTFYKAFQQARPRHTTDDDGPGLLDPGHFVSERLKQLYTDARRYARLNVPVLILGERGTGKTTLASWIRSNSPFRSPDKDASWPSVPCSQYTPETMRAELFGYVKGAFTDAKHDTEGLLHMADGDTLFLDEIGDISRDLQRLLIRALEEKQFIRVGGRTPETSDFRLISATNQTWTELQDRLDLDFLDRISLLVLEVPPLREVREDLPWLWRQVYQRALQRARVPVDAAPLTEADHAQVVRHLAQHPLPGNLRDLFRVAYQLIVSGLDGPDAEAPPGGRVAQALAHGLTPATTAPPTAGDGLAQAVAAAFAAGAPLDPLLEAHPEISTREIERTLRRYLAEEIRRIARLHGHKPQDLCDVTDRTLQKWIKEES